MEVQAAALATRGCPDRQGDWQAAAVAQTAGAACAMFGTGAPAERAEAVGAARSRRYCIRSNSRARFCPSLNNSGLMWWCRGPLVRRRCAKSPGCAQPSRAAPSPRSGGSKPELSAACIESSVVECYQSHQHGLQAHAARVTGVHASRKPPEGGPGCTRQVWQPEVQRKLRSGRRNMPGFEA